MKSELTQNYDSQRQIWDFYTFIHHSGSEINHFLISRKAAVLGKFQLTKQLRKLCTYQELPLLTTGLEIATARNPNNETVNQNSANKIK